MKTVGAIGFDIVLGPICDAACCRLVIDRSLSLCEEVVIGEIWYLSSK
jgi:hypothetical protein